VNDGSLDGRLAGLSEAKRQLFWRRVGGGRPPAAGMSVQELAAEAVLPPDIDPPASRPPPAPGPRSVLLTGATGFLGAFLLDELLRAPPVSCCCLVRAPDEAEARRRILANLAAYRLPPPDGARIVPVVGDLASPLLGLTRRRFDELAERCDAILHAGAAVKWTYPYAALKAANVGGTREVLRLAAHRRAKPVHFISTVGVFASPQPSGTPISEAEPLEASGPLHVGYAQSKWVAEKLVRLAGDRGLPVAVYRPNVGGHSRTGAFNPRDYLCLLIKGSIHLRCSPQLDLSVAAAPVDFVARAIVTRLGRPSSHGATFHLVNPQPLDWNELSAWLGRQGYPLESLPYEDWRRRLERDLERSAENPLRGLAPLFSESILAVARLPRFACHETLLALADTAVVCPPLDGSLLATYLAGFIRGGYLEAPPYSRS
jgi:thioester reductase-like protein